jgi:hypothetical protein
MKRKGATGERSTQREHKHVEENLKTLLYKKEEGGEKLSINNRKCNISFKKWTFKAPFNSKPLLLLHPCSEEKGAGKLIPVAQK